MSSWKTSCQPIMSRYTRQSQDTTVKPFAHLYRPTRVSYVALPSPMFNPIPLSARAGATLCPIHYVTRAYHYCVVYSSRPCRCEIVYPTLHTSSLQTVAPCHECIAGENENVAPPRGYLYPPIRDRGLREAPRRTTLYCQYPKTTNTTAAAQVSVIMRHHKIAMTVITT